MKMTGQQERESGSTKKTFGDTNGDGRIDIDDALIAIRECFRWVFSWRGAMALFGLGLVGSAALNIASWVKALGVLGGLAPMAGFTVWGTVQAIELLPIMDDLNLQSSLSAMVRRQRKPLEVPVLNETLNPDAKRIQNRYKRRESDQEVLGEFVRYALYGLEFTILLLGGGLVNYLGVSWGNILLAGLGIVGVELCLRMFNYAGDRILSKEEREFMRQIQQSVSRQSVRLD